MMVDATLQCADCLGLEISRKDVDRFVKSSLFKWVNRISIVTGYAYEKRPQVVCLSTCTYLLCSRHGTHDSRAPLCPSKFGAS